MGWDLAFRGDAVAAVLSYFYFGTLFVLLKVIVFSSGEVLLLVGLRVILPLKSTEKFSGFFSKSNEVTLV